MTCIMFMIFELYKADRDLNYTHIFADCYEENNATRGQILSRNYPSYISANKDCVYVIKPDGSNTTQYLLQINEFRNGYPRDIQVNLKK